MAKSGAERAAKYRATDPEEKRARAAAYMREWTKRPENREKVQKWNRGWRSANPEKSKAINRAASLRSRERNTARYLWHCAKQRARKLGLPFTITEADIVVPGVCPVLGVPMKQRSGPHSPTLDRRQPALGYVPGNVAVISRRANQIKSDATPEEIRRVAAWLDDGV